MSFVISEELLQSYFASLTWIIHRLHDSLYSHESLINPNFDAKESEPLVDLLDNAIHYRRRLRAQEHHQFIDPTFTWANYEIWFDDVPMARESDVRKLCKELDTFITNAKSLVK
jgi:hypothetical protein